VVVGGEVNGPADSDAGVCGSFVLTNIVAVWRGLACSVEMKRYKTLKDSLRTPSAGSRCGLSQTAGACLRVGGSRVSKY
jgi:hypothetical protein